MTDTCKRFADLRPADFETHPVWEAALDLEVIDDTLYRPVAELPVDDLGIRIVGTKVCLANGMSMWAAIENIDLQSAYKTRHLMSLAFFRGGRWIHLDRYHDYNLKEYGPQATATKLGLKVADVFPISYDVSGCCLGEPGAVAGVIESDPKDKLTRDQILDLIMDKSRPPT